MMEILASVVTLSFAAQVLRIAVPYVLGALGAAVTERSGVVDLAVEAKLLFGALLAAVVGHATGSMLLGIVAGAAAGAAVAGFQAWCVLRVRADQVVVGIALNLIAMAGTRYLLQVFYGEGADSPAFTTADDEIGGHVLLGLAVAGTWFLPWMLARTRLGLRIRAAGDRSAALTAVGVSAVAPRWAATLLGGALAGLGGAQLSLAIGQFTAEMSSGRGYMALAAVLLAGWRPARAALVCLAFAAAEAINLQLQNHNTGIPRELAPLLPCILTLVVLAGLGGGRRPPRELGKM
jgi:simple sugar transport system permease protein